MLINTFISKNVRSFSTSTKIFQNVEVRVRFAPSPTGSIHLGGLRTALYNYIFARKNNGRFILRIEDTDRTRIVPGSVEEIEDVLDWAGLKRDEGPRAGGDYGPYFQSERLGLYKDHAHDLLERGHAYRCFCSPKRLELMRNYQARNREKPRYDRKCMNLSPSEIKEKLHESKGAYVLRFALKTQHMSYEDLIHGLMQTNYTEDTLESDPVILKGDGFPTYHFANVVDDHLMKISHVLRGSEWISSTSKHIQIYQAFNWPQPSFAHFPLIVMRDGTKMSKRNNQSHVKAWKELGYRPMAILNFLTNMGGGLPKEKQDAMDLWDLDRLVEGFNFDLVNCNSGSIDLERLRIYNSKDIHHSWSENPQCILLEFREVLKRHKVETDLDDTALKTVLSKFINRIITLDDLVSQQNTYVWRHPDLTWDIREYTDDGWNLTKIIEDTIDMIHNLDLEDQASLGSKLREIADNHGKDWRQFMRLIRKLLTNSDTGLPVHEIFSCLGKDSGTSQPGPVSHGENISQNQEESVDNLQNPCNRAGRRNAITPELHHIEPIRQTEMQEKMSNLSMSSGEGSSTGHSSNDKPAG